MLPYGEKIRQHLGGVVLIGQAVPDRHTGVLCQFLHDFLSETTVFDALIHSSQNSCCIRNAFLLSNL